MFSPRHLLPGVLLGAALLTGCHHDREQPTPTPAEEVDPASIPLTEYDVLAKAAGHWKWESSTAGWGGRYDSSRVGYARRLVFQRDSTVAIYHNNVLVANQPYSIFTGLPQCCNAAGPRKMIEYANEPGIPNSNRRILRVTRGSAYSSLRVDGECACVDAPSYEGFVWVPKR